MAKKSATLHVKVYYPGVVLERDFDFDVVAKLKEKYLRYLDTGRANGAILYNHEQKKFAIIDLKKFVH
ncbi:hypothetical protein [Methanotorris igneus]|uniref:Uncharacterized protein n=1 Tax=Methanotorris igneus (strain DSM 5666 / JCM 11834 / Kol 5) TaxID=880724 RepID=F6BEQ0_METIK|nr:hypothetical protein [Methanotorris igneus]AEF96847.1 hypothetical protein Metig_1310 [Methanotorris igneus Kol 5]